MRSSEIKLRKGDCWELHSKPSSERAVEHSVAGCVYKIGENHGIRRAQCVRLAPIQPPEAARRQSNHHYRRADNRNPPRPGGFWSGNRSRNGSDESVTVAWKGPHVTGSFSGVVEGLSNAALIALFKAWSVSPNDSPGQIRDRIPPHGSPLRLRVRAGSLVPGAVGPGVAALSPPCAVPPNAYPLQKRRNG